MKRPPETERAVSELIGALILISVIIAALALVGVMVLSQPPPQKIPALNAIISTNTQTVNIYHNGGDSFRAEDLQLLLNGQDFTSSFKEDGSAGWSTWSVGQSLTYDIPPGNPVPSLIQIVYIGGGVSHLIASTGEGSPGGALPVPAPVVTAITPNSGLGGTVVSITNLAGLNFFSGATVKLTRAGYPDIPASGVTVVSSTQITCSFNLAGAAPGAWNVVVTNPDGPSGTLANGFTVVAAIPPVAAFTGTPLTGPIPLTVSFTDQSANIPTSWYWNFGDGQYSSLQNPNNTYASAGNYSVSLTATNAYGSNITVKSGYIFTYIPAVANFTGTPTSGPASLTVYFTDLSTGSPFSFFWQFGDIAIVNTSTLQNPGHTYDTVGVYSVNLTVANSYSSSSLVRTGYINVTPPPPTVYIINTTPTSGLPPLTVSWLGLASNAPILSWLWDFGDGSPQVTTQSATHTFTSSGTYNVSLTATNAGGSGTAYQLITVYFIPTFTSITPNSGSTLGGTPVTIVGTNFADGGAFGVTIGGNPATSVVRVNSTHITAVTPAGTVGAKNVVITNNGGQTATGTNAYTYVALPTFTSITPNSGPPAGGTPVTIVGTNFVSGGLFGVTIGGNPATSVVRINATHITAVTPAGTLGAKNVVITNNDGQTATGFGAYTYANPPPTFTTITPNSGLTTGVTPVTIVGGNFVNGGSFGVTIGGVAATNVTLVDASHITASTPPGTAGAKNVVITNNDGQTATGTGAYTYITPPPTVTGISPSIGTILGGTSVTVTGTDFTGATAVTFGATTAPSFTVDSATQITVTSPAGSSPGPVDVTVTTPSGTSATSPADIFRYYVIQSFTTVGTTSWAVPSGVTTVEYLVVAGGGGGGRSGGGGGAGGFRTGTLTGLSGSQTVTVGGGGAGATSTSVRGTKGGNSVFATITSTGGGGGGSSGNAAVYTGAPGGSGGGGTRLAAGGAGNTPAVSPSQGNNGGAGSTNAGTYLGGGGGGAGAAGVAATTTVAGNGGAGSSSSISGSLVTYAGGGGGGCNALYTAGTGGVGGGGAGGDGAVGQAGTTNSGGGGGGSGQANRVGGSGGSGIVIIKFY
jgi:PKD repeat protein